ncbi:MAG: hypothetical protein ACREJ9_01455 [Candidatus Rokuibacteriota bacterium]
MKKVIVAVLVAIFALVPVLAVAQSGGGTGGTQKPGSSSPTDKPGGTGSPSGGQGTMPGGSPAASPPGTSDTHSQFRSKADCEGAGGVWTEATKTCKRK